MHAAQPQQPGRAAASAAVPLEYFQCVYSHTTHSALTAAIPTANQSLSKASTAQPLCDQPMSIQALPAAAAAIPVSQSEARTRSAALQQPSICSREAE